jgi:precorrin-3B methylase
MKVDVYKCMHKYTLIYGISCDHLIPWLILDMTIRYDSWGCFVMALWNPQNDAARKANPNR